MSDVAEITLELQEGYRFLVDFGDERLPRLLVDEPAPLGDGAGPNAVRLLGAAVGNCLSASALFCLQKAHVDVRSMRTRVQLSQERDDRGRLRVSRIDVSLHPEVADADRPRIHRCLELFEDFCVVTQSVRGGVDVRVTVDTGRPSGDVVPQTMEVGSCWPRRSRRTR